MIGWLQCATGVSGDMLLGALVDAGVPLGLMNDAVGRVAPEPVTLRASRVTRAGIVATKVDADVDPSTQPRTWTDVRAVLSSADFPGQDQALATFEALALAESAVHGGSPGDVHFHEVGALDAIADVVGVCAGFAVLDLSRLVVSSLALGGGWVRSSHGRLAVPGPAVGELIQGIPSHGGPVPVELTTPTGAALVRTWATGWGAQPPMRVTRQAFGAGTRELGDRANVVRLMVGDERDAAEGPLEHTTSAVTSQHVVTGRLVVETNVDDLDGRLWPHVLTALLDAGADDAWLVPILMKKGRSAHTLRVLTGVEHAAAVTTVIFTHTSAIGVREEVVTRRALARSSTVVEVSGHPVRVKLAHLGGHTVNAQPEWEDVQSVAAVLGRPPKVVLAQAGAAFWASQPPDGPGPERP